jgi:Zn-dependent peptidase ImmA (M78 family)
MNSPGRAEKKAIAILEQVGIDGPPVPVERVATTLGAQLTYEPFEGDVSGLLYRSDEGALIGVNSTQAATRQRFTIAHEIGHLVMHRGKPMYVDRFVRVNWRNGVSDQQEIEANAFAAELLMPRAFVKDALARTLAGGQVLSAEVVAQRLAKSFHVSPEAMTYRLANLGLVDPYALTG